jgi:hypothetical protein
LPDKSSGSPRLFSRHSLTRAASSLRMIIRASEPPMKPRLSMHFLWNCRNHPFLASCLDDYASTAEGSTRLN